MHDVIPYRKEAIDWKMIIKGKYILFDADPIISIMKYKAEDLLSDFKNLNCINCYIHPVKTELMGSKNNADRVSRLEFMSRHDFQYIPLTKNEFQSTNFIQARLSTINRYPSLTDLYLGGVLAKFSASGNTLLLTGNTQDFPLPIYKREAEIILESNTQRKVLSFLSIDLQTLSIN